MIEETFHANIRASAENVFDIILDLDGQDRWLPKSLAYRGTDEISSSPVVLGTTYREPGFVGVRRGTVTELSRPTRIAFHQPMSLRARLGVVDAAIRYELRQGNGYSEVTESLTVSFSGSARFCEPVFRPLFRHERRRTLRALRVFAERL